MRCRTSLSGTSMAVTVFNPMLLPKDSATSQSPGTTLKFRGVDMSPQSGGMASKHNHKRDGPKVMIFTYREDRSPMS